ncbi:MAG TPA: hypothetical protein VKR53_12270 [Puia sp.]|nr:hypothetical protein [Puia sp.]
MEVHHHPDMHQKRKKLKEYFLEFLMIFLAVTMGFFAESIREHLADHSKEKQYINSMIADLKGDTAGLREVIDANIKKVSGIDTMTSLLNKPSLTMDEEKQLYILNSRYASNIARMDWNDGTIRQLLTSGNLRLMSEQGISDSMMNYYGPHKDLATGQAEILYESVKRTFFGAEDIFDRTFTKRSMNKDSSFSRKPMPDTMRLLTKKKTVLKNYAQMALTMQALINNYLSMLFGMYKRAENLLVFLQARYDIQ